MRENFVLNFPGFANSNSQCHIRILADPDKPVVIVCSQFLNYTGTSIMNAYEIIRGYIYDYLSMKHRNELKEEIAQELDHLAKIIEKTRKFRIAFVVYLLRFAAKLLTNRLPFIKQLKESKPEIYWVEHWPEGSGILTGTNYLLVSENEVGDPSWKKIDVASISKSLGYEQKDFEIPDEIVA